MVGMGTGTFTESDRATFNYGNPLLRDTFSVWDLGWTAIRFKARNVGAWPFHCTMAIHAVQGMGFNVITSPDKLSTPPPGLMSCTMTSVDPEDAQVCTPESEQATDAISEEVVSAAIAVVPALHVAVAITYLFVCI